MLQAIIAENLHTLPAPEPKYSTITVTIPDPMKNRSSEEPETQLIIDLSDYSIKREEIQPSDLN
jgi:hypothetical protein